MSEALNDEVADYVDWRYSSLSEWMREAAVMRMALEDALAAQGVDLPEDADARQALIETVVRTGVAAAGDDLPDGG